LKSYYPNILNSQIPAIAVVRPTRESNQQSPNEPANVVLIGNPNSGKTSLFNALTGLRYKVGNYPGVTVERRVGEVSLGEYRYSIADLPGIYCLEDYSIDERVAVAAVQGELGEKAPEVVLVVIDATMLERGLYLATELIDRKLPVVIAITMMDLLAKRGERVRFPLLQQRLSVPIIPIKRDRPRESHELLGNAMQQVIELRQSAEQLEPIGEKDRSNENTITTASSEESAKRYARIEELLEGCVVRSSSQNDKNLDSLDALLTHGWWGIAVFIGVMALLFQAVFSLAALPMDLVEVTVTWCGEAVGALLPNGLLKSLLVDGVIAGLGSVLVFLPQIGLLFLLLSLLEESGYLVRAAFLMDTVLRRVGLQGRSFIPLLSSFACAIPGIMATRVIGSPTDRLLTILVAPLMSCSARLPVYALLISAFFPEHYLGGFVSLRGLVLFSLYGLGIVGAAAVAWIFSRFFLRGEPSVFVMEMPPLRLPSLRAAVVSSVDRVLFFLRSTGPVILASSIVLWALASFPGDTIEQSYAGMIGQMIEPLFAPLGFSWEVCVALICSFAAREVFVSALGTILNVSASAEGDAQTVAALIRDQQILTFPAAVAALVFVVFACQCMSTLAVVRRETGTWRWPIVMFVYMTALAWGGAWVAAAVVRLGS